MLSARDIMASNVLPALKTSLDFGATEVEIERACGWTLAALAHEGAVVPGESTYRHMEWMYRHVDFAGFTLEAARRYSLASLGLIGMACKTAATVADALSLHQRYQGLTNRSASYEAILEGDALVIEEAREDPSLGSQLISEYTMFVAVHLLRSASAQAPQVRQMEARRASIPALERSKYEAYLGAPMSMGAARARLTLDAALLEAPLRAADAELGAWFRGALARALPQEGSAPLLQGVRRAIQEGLPQGSATLAQVARALGVGPRTLQRQLQGHGLRFEALLEETRRVLAAEYLRDPSQRLVEVAWLLGYSEQAAFTRAFRRWYGASPGAWRAAQGQRVL
jgi:AraC-like DNA-binding protein